MATAPLTTETRTSPSRSLPHRTIAYAKAHKVIASIVAIVFLGAAYYAYGALTASASPTTYVTSSVATGTIVASVTGSGQVDATTEVTLSPQSSGVITYVGVKQGQQVSKGTLLVQVDPTTAEKSVRDAESSLTAAQISYQQAVSSSGNSILTARDNGFDTATAAYSDISSVTQDLNATLLGTTAGYAGEANATAYADVIAPYEPTAETASQTALDSYQAALASYNQSFALYQAATRTSSPATVETLLQSTNDSVTKANQATKDALTFLNLVQTTLTAHNQLKVPPSLAAQITTTTADATKISAENSSVLSALTTLQNATVTLNGSGSDVPLSVQSAQLSLTNAQNALQDAKNNLSNTEVVALFDGTVATLNATVGNSAGSSVATMITAQESAVLSLDEVDAAKVQLGQKATLTFDAIPDLTLTGTVTGVDTLGTVSQGVVSYDITITFDSQDARVKPGMTVSASIITDSAVDVLTVPSSAIKTTNGASYVQVFNPPLSASSTSAAGGMSSSVPPKSVTVTTGISDDTNTQILSGLTAGEQIVVRTSTASAATASTAARTTTTAAAGGAGAARGGAAGGGLLRGL